jgi:hypothetical protein
MAPEKITPTDIATAATALMILDAAFMRPLVPFLVVPTREIRTFRFRLNVLA